MVTGNSLRKGPYPSRTVISYLVFGTCALRAECFLRMGKVPTSIDWAVKALEVSKSELEFFPPTVLPQLDMVLNVFLKGHREDLLQVLLEDLIPLERKIIATSFLKLKYETKLQKATDGLQAGLLSMPHIHPLSLSYDALSPCNSPAPTDPQFHSIYSNCTESTAASLPYSPSLADVQRSHNFATTTAYAQGLREFQQTSPLDQTSACDSPPLIATLKTEPRDSFISSTLHTQMQAMHVSPRSALDLQHQSYFHAIPSQTSSSCISYPSHTVSGSQYQMANASMYSSPVHSYHAFSTPQQSMTPSFRQPSIALDHMYRSQEIGIKPRQYRYSKQMFFDGPTVPPTESSTEHTTNDNLQAVVGSQGWNWPLNFTELDRMETVQDQLKPFNTPNSNVENERALDSWDEFS